MESARRTWSETEENVLLIIVQKKILVSGSNFFTPLSKLQRRPENKINASQNVENTVCQILYFILYIHFDIPFT